MAIGKKRKIAMDHKKARKTAQMTQPGGMSKYAQKVAGRRAVAVEMPNLNAA